MSDDGPTASDGDVAMASSDDDRASPNDDTTSSSTSTLVELWHHDQRYLKSKLQYIYV